ncbi:MAG: LacI family transcriptional regulator [Acidobacteria bacterium]|nr:LacI family transcriptional regulator [Acidobacteriota bacterium]
MPTIKDVAALAGVSVATVSRVLNQSGYADADTRTRVLDAVSELGYKTNIHWSRLKRKSSNTILFLLSNHANFNTFHTRVLEACEKNLRAKGYDLVFARHEYTGDMRPVDLPLPSMLNHEGSIDGVLLAGIHYQNLVSVLRKRQIPFAMLGNNFEGFAGVPPHNCVSFDDLTAMQDATQYLLRLGHRRVAFIGNTSFPWFRNRHAGYLRAIDASELTAMGVTENWRISNIDYGTLALAQLLREQEVPTAILAGNDEIAAGCWKELTRRQIQIPSRISLIGIGDRPEFSILEPALTSISVFPEQLGERLTLMLIEQIRNPRLSLPSELLPCKLMERASCAPPPEEFKLHTLKRNSQ